MATPAITPAPSSGPSQGPAGGAQPSGGGMAIFARIAMLLDQAAQQFPSFAPKAREMKDGIRQETIKAIQGNGAPPQQTPQI